LALEFQQWICVSTHLAQNWTMICSEREGLMETREEYYRRTRSRLEELRAQVRIVETRADEAAAEVRDEYQEQREALLVKYETVERKLQELKDASDETWEDVRAKVDGALSDLNNSVGNVLSHMAKSP
jgi:multidrug resistance efflux pump